MFCGEEEGLTKVGDLAGQIDAVDEDVAVGDLLCLATLAYTHSLYTQTTIPTGERTKRAALGSLSHIPPEDVFLRHAGLAEGIASTGTAAAEGADDDDAWQATGLLGAGGQGLLDVLEQRGLVRVALDAGERLLGAMLELPGPGLEGESGTGETGMVAKGLVVVVSMEFASLGREEGKN
jgi:hypothetical protein